MFDFLMMTLINIVDLFIYRYYLDVFVRTRKHKGMISVFFLILLAAAWACVNMHHYPGLNLLTLFLVLFLFLLQYTCKISSSVLAVLIYIGVGMIAETFGLFCLYLSGHQIGNRNVGAFYLAVIFSEIVRFTLVVMFCRCKKEERIRLSSFPKKVRILLVVIPLLSVCINYCVVMLSMQPKKKVNLALCVCTMVVITLVNYLVLYMVERCNEYSNKKHEAERYMDEIRYKDAYYQEVEACNEQIKKIRHDVKNRLSALSGLVEAGDIESLHIELQKINGEMEEVQQKMYCENPILNSVLRVKNNVATKKDIRTTYHILIPSKMQLDYGDIGILYGNLLDNAIEACEKLPEEERWITMDNKYMDGKLFLKLQNAKSPESQYDGKTTKPDATLHGRGLSSVQRVVDKYNGSIIIEDRQTCFEVCLVLFGIQAIE